MRRFTVVAGRSVPLLRLKQKHSTLSQGTRFKSAPTPDPVTASDPKFRISAGRAVISAWSLQTPGSRQQLLQLGFLRVGPWDRDSGANDFSRK